MSEQAEPIGIAGGKRSRSAGRNQSRSSERALNALHRSRPAGATVNLHSTEISSRHFSRSTRGLDPLEVTEWLRMVEESYAALEDEVTRLRQSWDDLLISAARTRGHLSGADSASEEAWRHLARALVRVRPTAGIPAVHAQATRTVAEGHLKSKKALRAALASSMNQLARTQETALRLESANEQLRTQLIETVFEGPAA